MKKIDLREVWQHEAIQFTKWLAKDENLSLLSDEIGIEISEQLLREYHLTLGDVSSIIAASSLDLPAGSVRTENGEIMLRTTGQAYVQQDFESIALNELHGQFTVPNKGQSASAPLPPAPLEKARPAAVTTAIKVAT